MIEFTPTDTSGLEVGDTVTFDGKYVMEPRPWWAFWRKPKATGELRKFKIISVSGGRGGS